jgi:hypothetical protein
MEFTVRVDARRLTGMLSAYVQVEVYRTALTLEGTKEVLVYSGVITPDVAAEITTEALAMPAWVMEGGLA